MNVGFVSHSAELAGAERYLLEAIGLVIDSGGRAFVSLPKRGPLGERLREAGVDHIVTPYHWWAVRYRTPLWRRAARQAVSLAAALPVARFFSRHRCDLVLTNSETVFTGALAARLIGRPHVWQLHELRSAWEFDFGDTLSSGLMNWTTELFIANSRATRRGYLPFLDEKKIRLIYPWFGPGGRPSFKRRDESDVFRAVVVGTIAPHKRQLDAVAAIDRLRRKGRAVSLDLVGGGAIGAGVEGYREEMKRYIERAGLEGAVRFLGQVDDPLPHIAGADALIQASPESFGRSVVEAMFAGTVVVASSRGAAPEILSDGETGLLYKCGDVKGLTGQIDRLIEEKELGERLARAASESAASLFDPVFTRKGLLELLESAL